MPRISSELNKRSRKLLRPRELPTWWNLFSGALIAVVLAYMLWNLIADRGGVAAPVTAPDTTSVVVQTIPIDGTASPSSSVPGVTSVVTQPVTSTPGDLVDVPTYAGSSVSVPRGAVLAAEAFAKGAQGVVIDRTLRSVDTGVWLFDVRVDLDGAGPVAPGMVIVQVEGAVGGTYAASRAG
jgi:hypothetical protein